MPYELLRDERARLVDGLAYLMAMVDQDSSQPFQAIAEGLLRANADLVRLECQRLGFDPDLLIADAFRQSCYLN